MYKQDRYDLRTPINRPKERFDSDLMYKEVVFVYPVTITKGALGGQTCSWAAVPVPLNASVQVNALNGQAVEPQNPPNRIAHLYTRKRNGILWHDKLRWCDIIMRAEYVEERLENDTGLFQYLYVRALLLSEKDFVDGTPAINTVV